MSAELLANAVGHWQSKAATKKWWLSGWNVFDAIVVTAGILTMCVTLPDSVSLIRNLRAFRVFRLFKRIKSLNKIISSLGAPKEPKKKEFRKSRRELNTNCRLSRCARNEEA